MCNEYQLTLPLSEVIEEFHRNHNPLQFPDGLPNFGPNASIRIGDRAPIIVQMSDGPVALVRPWGWKGAHGKPVFNFVTEGRSFAQSQRCLIPADGFFEFTDKEPGQTRKTKWRFTMANHRWFWIVGIVREGAFTLLTTSPGPDIAPYHDRQIVLLPPSQARSWLELTQPQETLLKPASAHTLSVAKVFPAQAG